MVHSFRSDELQKIVSEAVEYFLKGPIESFPTFKPFIGGGVYTLYYMGDFPIYSNIKVAEVKPGSVPIYMGKSIQAAGERQE